MPVPSTNPATIEPGDTAVPSTIGADASFAIITTKNTPFCGPRAIAIRSPLPFDSIGPSVYAHGDGPPLPDELDALPFEPIIPVPDDAPVTVLDDAPPVASSTCKSNRVTSAQLAPSAITGTRSAAPTARAECMSPSGCRTPQRKKAHCLLAQGPGSSWTRASDRPLHRTPPRPASCPRRARRTSLRVAHDRAPAREDARVRDRNAPPRVASATSINENFAALDARTVPAGTIIAFGGNSIPAGWIACDGQEVDRADYPDLFDAIGVTYGEGDSTTTFNVPDLRGRDVVGAGQGAGLTNRALAAKGGAESTTLVQANLAPHTHGVNETPHTHSATAAAHTHTNTAGMSLLTAGQSTYQLAAGANYGIGPATLNNATPAISVSFASTGITLQSTGNGQPFERMQPFVVLRYLIKS
ncbi:MAG: tail fiber protein [Polyangiaceae bacterium]